MTRQHPNPPASHVAPAPLDVLLPSGQTRRFVASFRIGRDPDCDVRLDDVEVSRRHASVTLAAGKWTIRDLQSSNGLFVDGERVESAPVEGVVTVRLGAEGPALQLALEGYEVPPPPIDASSEMAVLEDAASRDSETADDEPPGERTMIWQAFHRQRRRYRVIVAVLALAVLAAATLAFHQHQQLATLKADARNRFYRMKRLDVQAIERSEQGSAQLPQLVVERQRLEKEYRGLRQQLVSARPR